MGKAKPAKHTAAEIKAKVAAATTNKGGGNAGKEDRLGGKAGHAKYKCPVCAQQAPDMKTMQVILCLICCSPILARYELQAYSMNMYLANFQASWCYSHRTLHSSDFLTNVSLLPDTF